MSNRIDLLGLQGTRDFDPPSPDRPNPGCAAAVDDWNSAKRFHERCELMWKRKKDPMLEAILADAARNAAEAWDKCRKLMPPCPECHNDDNGGLEKEKVPGSISNTGICTFAYEPTFGSSFSCVPARDYEP